jgi:hypothetical protein
VSGPIVICLGVALASGGIAAVNVARAPNLAALGEVGFYSGLVLILAGILLVTIG